MAQKAIEKGSAKYLDLLMLPNDKRHLQVFLRLNVVGLTTHSNMTVSARAMHRVHYQSNCKMTVVISPILTSLGFNFQDKSQEAEPDNLPIEKWS